MWLWTSQFSTVQVYTTPLALIANPSSIINQHLNRMPFIYQQSNQAWIDNLANLVVKIIKFRNEAIGIIVKIYTLHK